MPRKFKAGQAGSNNWNLFQRYAKTEAFGWDRDEVRRRYNLWKEKKPYLDAADSVDDDDCKHGDWDDDVPARPASHGGGGGGAAAASGAQDQLASFRVDPRSGLSSLNQFQAHFRSRDWSKTTMSDQWSAWKARYGEASRPSPPLVQQPAPAPAPRPGPVAGAPPPFKPWSKNPWNDFQSFFKSRQWGRAETRRRYYLWAEDKNGTAYMAADPARPAADGQVLPDTGGSWDEEEEDDDFDEAAVPEPDTVGDTSLQELVQSEVLPVAPEVALRLRLLVRGTRCTFDVAIEKRQPSGCAVFALRVADVSAAHPKVFVGLACDALGARVAREDEGLAWGPLEMASTGEKLDKVAARFVAEVSAPQDSLKTLADLAEKAETALAANRAGTVRRCSGTSSSTGEQCRRRTTDASGRCYAHRVNVSAAPASASDPVMPDTSSPAAKAGPCRWLVICSPGTIGEAGTGLARGAVARRPASASLRNDVGAARSGSGRMDLFGVPADFVTALRFSSATGAETLPPVMCDDVSEPETKLKRAFQNSLREKNSTLVVYYSGHGHSSRGAWCFANKRAIGPRHVLKLWVETKAERHATARLLIISDSCHSGAWARTMRSWPNIAVQASCESHEVCGDLGLDIGGAFTSAFLGGFDARGACSTAARAHAVAARLKDLGQGHSKYPQHATATGFGRDNSDMDAAPGVRLVSVRGRP